MGVVLKWSRGWQPPLLVPYYPMFLPQLFNLVAGLHALYAEEVQGSIDVAYQMIFALPRDATASDVWDESLESMELLHCRVAAGVRFDAAAELSLDFDAQIELVQWWLSKVQANCYTCLGAAMEPEEFYALPDVASLLAGTVLSGLDVLPLHQLRRLIATVVTTVRSRCPKDARAAIGDQFMFAWLSAMLERLEEEWEIEAERRASQANATEEELAFEVMHEAALSNLSQSFATQVRALAIRLPRGPPTDDDIEKCLVLTEPMRTLYTGGVLKMLAWPSPDVQFVACGVAARLAVVFAEMPDFVELVFEMMFPMMLHVLTVVEEEYDIRRVLDDVRDVYKVVAPYDRERARAVLLGMPGVDDRAMVAFDAAVDSGAAFQDNQSAFRDLLQRTIGANTLRALHRVAVDDAAPTPAAPLSDMRGRYGGPAIVVE
eukprot:Amastigsp_a339561_9.p1 type:complete len:432 gc:universal Amastigsp_a339561_9:1308-13(-)